MTFFEKTKDLDLYRHFDPSHPDVRIQTRELFLRAKKAVAREKEINLEVVLLIGCLERQNAAVNLGLGKREILAEKLGLTINQYWKRAQAGRVLTRFPEFIDLIREGKTHVSHIAMLAPKITEANKDVFLTEVSGKSERQIQELKSTVRRDGSREEAEPVFDIKVQLTKSQLALLDRAREVLSSSGQMPTEGDVLVKALGDLLEKRDPMRKAERAERRREKKLTASVPKAPGKGAEVSAMTRETSPSGNTPLTSSLKKMTPQVSPKTNGTKEPEATPATSVRKSHRSRIPAQTRHRLMIRDGGKCSYIDASGERCGARVALQEDHVVPLCHGGTHELSNLRLLCRRHNQAEADRLIGHEWMSQYRESKPIL